MTPRDVEIDPAVRLPITPTRAISTATIRNPPTNLVPVLRLFNAFMPAVLLDLCSSSWGESHGDETASTAGDRKAALVRRSLTG
jgi:hypothetical protein